MKQMKVKSGGTINYRGALRNITQHVLFSMLLTPPPSKLTVMGIYYCVFLNLIRHFEDKGHWWTFAKKREVRRWVLTLITGQLLTCILIFEFLSFDFRGMKLVYIQLLTLSLVHVILICFISFLLFLPVFINVYRIHMRCGGVVRIILYKGIIKF